MIARLPAMKPPTTSAIMNTKQKNIAKMSLLRAAADAASRARAPALSPPVTSTSLKSCCRTKPLVAMMRAACVELLFQTQVSKLATLSFF